jgi:hypothetical protein
MIVLPERRRSIRYAWRITVTLIVRDIAFRDYSNASSRRIVRQRFVGAQSGQGPQPKRAAARTLVVRFPLVAEFLPGKQAFTYL